MRVGSDAIRMSHPQCTVQLRLWLQIWIQIWQ